MWNVFSQMYKFNTSKIIVNIKQISESLKMSNKLKIPNNYINIQITWECMILFYIVVVKVDQLGDGSLYTEPFFPKSEQRRKNFLDLVLRFCWGRLFLILQLLSQSQLCKPFVTLFLFRANIHLAIVLYFRLFRPLQLAKAPCWITLIGFVLQKSEKGFTQTAFSQINSSFQNRLFFKRTFIHCIFLITITFSFFLFKIHIRFLSFHKNLSVTLYLEWLSRFVLGELSTRS